MEREKRGQKERREKREERETERERESRESIFQWALKNPVPEVRRPCPKPHSITVNVKCMYLTHNQLPSNKVYQTYKMADMVVYVRHFVVYFC